MTNSTGSYRWTAFLCLHSPWEGQKMSENHYSQITWSKRLNFMMLVWLREPLEENLILIKHYRKNFSTSTSWGVFLSSLKPRIEPAIHIDRLFLVYLEIQLISTNNTRTNYESIFKSLKTFLYDFNQNCLFKHRILFFTSSYFAFRNFFLICCQTKITS